MPNGGSDNCGYCVFNRVVREALEKDDPKALWTRSHCLLRDVHITSPMWTYCANCDHGVSKPLRKEITSPKGWILATGRMKERYTRIPWDGHREPVNKTSATCYICGRQEEDGITLQREGETLGFCCNRHYVQWWRSLHDDHTWDPAQFDEPPLVGEGE